MLPRFGLGFNIPIKPLIIQILVALLFSCLFTVKCGYCGQTLVETVVLPVESFTLEHQDANWVTHGENPWLSTMDNETSYVECTGGIAEQYVCYWDFENLTLEEGVNASTVTLINVNLTTLTRHAAGGTCQVKFDLWDMTQYIWISDLAIAGTTWLFLDLADAKDTIDTLEKLQATRLKIRYYTGADGWISYVGLLVKYSYELPPPYSIFDEYFGVGLFLGGIIMMIYAPSWVAWKVKKSGVTPDTVERLGYAMLIFIVGFGLFLSFIYGSGA